MIDDPVLFIIIVAGMFIGFFLGKYIIRRMKK